MQDSPEPNVKAFVKGYEARYGSKPDMPAAQAYDATNIVLKAFVVAGGANGATRALGATRWLRPAIFRALLA